MKLLVALLSAASLLVIQSCGTKKMEVEDVVALTDTSVVVIHGYGASNQSMLGAGFIIESSGLIATNYHVIKDAERIDVTLSNGQTYPVIGIVDFNYSDPGYPDFAILKIDAPTDLPALPLGDDKKLRPGESVVTIGNPIAYTHTPSDGIFAQLRRMDSINYVQITAPISPGNSGGPLLNRYGEVVGINTFHDRRGQNLNFALSVQYLKDALTNHGHTVRFTVNDVLAMQKKRNNEQFTALFAPYEHPQKLFSMLYPRDWKTYQHNRWEYNDDPDSTYIQTSIFAPPGAFNPETGYLASGIRVMFFRPRNGYVWNGIIDRWPAAFKQRMLRMNHGFAFTDSLSIALDQIPSRLYTAIGRNENVSEVELDRFIISAQPNYLLSIEFACPNSQANAYDQYYEVIQKSFRFGLEGGTRN